MKPISKFRFDSIAGYSRSPTMPLIAEELAWFEAGNEKVLGLIVLDLTDQDYAYYVLGRDAKSRFRAVTIDVSIATQAEATSLLEQRLAEQEALPPEEFFQGDEVGRALDCFTPVGDPAKLSPIFASISTATGYSPARELLAQMMYYFQDLDGNFVEQFQTVMDHDLSPLSSHDISRRVSQFIGGDQCVPRGHSAKNLERPTGGRRV